MAFLRIENLGKSFGQVRVLNNISFEADAGEFVVLLGPSGCGKSTLLRLITGLTEEHEGEIYINGQRVTDLDPKYRKVAMVFQSYALYPHLSVAKNISFGMEINHVPKAERAARVAEAVRALQLEELLDRKPAKLSGGQRQRVAIGRCMVREPDLFLFDEPLSNLDAKLRHDTRTELKQLHQRLRATTVYVTHDQFEAMTLATQIVLMNAGEVVQVAKPLDLYDRPMNRFAATFVGSPQINLIKGQIAPEGVGGARFSSNDLSLLLPSSAFAAAPANPGVVELGLRPESAILVPDSHDATMMEVSYVEPTGADIFLYGRWGGEQIVARLDRRTRAAAGDKVPIAWRLDAAVVFDLDSGRRI